MTQVLQRDSLREAVARVWPALLLAVVLNAPWLASSMFLDDWHLLWKAHEAEWTWHSLSSSFTFLDSASISTWNLGEIPAYHYFRPLIIASFKVEMWLWGLSPVGFHAVSLLLHLVSTVLVGALVFAMKGERRLARVGALLFAIQPHNVASVLWTAGRTEVLAAPLVLAALLCFVAYTRRPLRRMQVGALLFTAVACFVKESVVLVGGFALLWEVHLGRTLKTPLRQWFKVAVPRLTPLALLLGGYLAYRFLVFDSGATLREPYFTDPASWSFPLFALAKTVHYLTALLLTIPIVPIFGTQFLLDHPVLLLLSLTLVTAALWLGARKANRNRLSALCLGWLAISFLPTLPILASDLYPYFAGIGFAMLLAGVVGSDTRRARIALVSLVALYCLSYSARGLLYHTQGSYHAAAMADVEEDLGTPTPPGTRLLLINMPVSVSHLASHLRLRSGHGDVRAILATVTPSWVIPTSGPRLLCTSDRTVRIFPSEGHDTLFDTSEEWNLQLFRLPLQQGKSYTTPYGFTATPLWAGDKVLALDLSFDNPLSIGSHRLYSFYLDDSGLAHPVCTETEAGREKL